MTDYACCNDQLVDASKGCNGAASSSSSEEATHFTVHSTENHDTVVIETSEQEGAQVNEYQGYQNPYNSNTNNNNNKSSASTISTSAVFLVLVIMHVALIV